MGNAFRKSKEEVKVVRNIWFLEREIVTFCNLSCWCEVKSTFFLLSSVRIAAMIVKWTQHVNCCRIVNSAYVTKRRTPSPRKCDVPKKDGKAAAKKAKRSKLLTDDLLPSPSDTNIQMMATFKSVFRFIELLPHHNLLPRTGDTPKQLNGLRVKFSDAEDNLLALGMKQHGKRWELIQEHLLPVKSPKQLQIRCKNLLSARAPENIVKYYRRNKVLWELPVKIKVSSGKTEGHSVIMFCTSLLRIFSHAKLDFSQSLGDLKS